VTTGITAPLLARGIPQLKGDVLSIDVDLFVLKIDAQGRMNVGNKRVLAETHEQCTFADRCIATKDHLVHATERGRENSLSILG
jgi:hypothetical protein